MYKLKNWLKIKLKKFLEIDVIEYNFKQHDIKNNANLEWLRNEIILTDRSLRKDISHCQESVNVLHNTVENVVHIGTDVYRENNGHSWAVICVEGKMDIVKFIDLDRKDAREIFDYLKHFEAGRHCIDSPYKPMFIEGLFKF